MHAVKLVYEKVGFVSTILHKDLAEMYPFCKIVGSSSQGMVLSQEDRVPELRGTTERYSAYGCGTSYCVCGRNSGGS
ncbi:hypothetical protein TNCV_4663191 [Trichonephila clavipes]|uniref:Uncharacterized protein n=1 Tax=Trichonephila clavipes TaxID=2585209 RepID=A0A8X6VIN2_TRICX|nr:hypothetical protein TNCV_4663191 [Trichonephila clavipes]